MGGMGTPYRVMTVCTGNICRSPMARIVLRDRFAAAGLGDRVVVDSTGTSAEEHGRPIDERAVAALTEHGYAGLDHTARQVRGDDLTGTDLVLAMTAEHAHVLRRLARKDTDAAARVVLYRSFDPASPASTLGRDEHLLDLDDPWYGGPEEFEDCLAQIEAAADGIVRRVQVDLAARAL